MRCLRCHVHIELEQFCLIFFRPVCEVQLFIMLYVYSTIISNDIFVYCYKCSLPTTYLVELCIL